MALAALSGDEQRIIFIQLCNVLEPRLAVYLSSVSNELRQLTQALRQLTQALLQQLRTDHEAAAVLCLKVGLRSCKELREGKTFEGQNKGLTAADLTMLGTLGSVLPKLETLALGERSPGTAGPDGLQRLAEGLGAGALSAMTEFNLSGLLVSDAGASALAAALGRGALPRLEKVVLGFAAAIGDVGLVALAPALRRLPALETLCLIGNPFGDEGIAALVASPPAGVLPPPAGVLTELKRLYLAGTQITDAGCAALAAALDNGVLPTLRLVELSGTLASAAGKAAVREAVARSIRTHEALPWHRWCNHGIKD